MSTKYVSVVLFVIFGVIAPILVQCKPLELISDNDEHGAEPSFNSNVNTPIPIISQTDMSSPDGSFSYSYETGNQIRQEARGYHKTVYVPSTRANDDGSAALDATDVLVQSGSYSYIAPDGQLISVSWIADENGYRATGDHIPTPHPTPEHLMQAFASNIHEEQQQGAQSNTADETKVITIESRPELSEQIDLE